MPLTFAHLAAVVPLARLKLPISALVVGSVAPDLIYFARLAPRGHFGHTLPGLFLLCLPAGLALLWVFHRLLKGPLTELAPSAAQRRLACYLHASPFDRPLVLVAAAVLSGAATHDVWDAFTHAGGWGVATASALRLNVALGPLGRIPVYKLAQHGSTLIGLVVLAYSVAAWWRHAPEADTHCHLPARTRKLRLSLLVAVPLAVGAAYAGGVAVDASAPLTVFVGRFVVSVTSAAFVTATLYSAWCRLRPDAAG